MKFFTSFLLVKLALSSVVNLRALTDGGSNGLPADGLSMNGVAFGFLPSSGDNGYTYTMAQINDKLGAKASTYGWYSQITSSNYDDSQLTGRMDDVVSSGAVFQPSVMPSIAFNEVTSDVATQVATSMKKFTDQGVEVWLRFAHEMNWYVQDGTYKGTPSEFATAWKNVAAAVKDNPKVKMYWSPNRVGNVADLAPWWPGQDNVDIVGIDCYPQSGEDIESLFDICYRDFYDSYSTNQGNKPFAIGETGAGPDQKEAWLTQLVSQDMSKYPNYVATSWFEYNKETDFRIVMGGYTTSTFADNKKHLPNRPLKFASNSTATTLFTSTTPAPSPEPSPACTWG
jgi:hypothetical protein